MSDSSTEKLVDDHGKLTKAAVTYLQEILGGASTRAQGGNDRGGFYLEYYNLIRESQKIKKEFPSPTLDSDPAEQVLLQAQISTFSGFPGGTATNARPPAIAATLEATRP
jgi:hypothetical protein